MEFESPIKAMFFDGSFFFKSNSVNQRYIPNNAFQ